MMETRALQSATSSAGASSPAPNLARSQQDTIARFREALNGPSTGTSSPAATHGNLSFSTEAERLDTHVAAAPLPATVGSLYYSVPVGRASSESAATANLEAAKLIEQAASVLVERPSRADASRFIVSLDHAIVGGAAAEFVREGAFLHVRLLARNDAAYRSMWAHRVGLEEKLAASTGLVTRVEIVEGYDDGRAA